MRDGLTTLWREHILNGKTIVDIDGVFLFRNICDVSD